MLTGLYQLKHNSLMELKLGRGTMLKSAFKYKSGLVTVILLCALVVLSACSSGVETEEPSGPGPVGEPETGTIEIRATDAPPTGITSVLVTVDNVEVHMSGAEEDSWFTVLDSENTFDLVDIQGAEVFLGDKEAEAGRYTKIRLDVTSVTVTLEGEELTAELPSDKLKVVRNWEVVAGKTTILTLDFEADKFVVVTGTGRVQIKPVIKLEVTQGDRPLKTKPETDKEAGDEDNEAEAPSEIPHDLAGRDDCLQCHAEGGLKPFPPDHADRTSDVCQSCHEASEGTVPTVSVPLIPHTL